jgi:hypothetical protein
MLKTQTLWSKLFKATPADAGPRPLKFAADPAKAWALFGEHMLNEQHGLPVSVQRLDSVQAQAAATYEPDGTVTHALQTALEVACVDYRHPYVALFRERSAALARELDRHPEHWGQRWRDGSGQRGHYLEGKALAQAWQGEDELDGDLLRQAADEMFRVTADQWHGHEQMQQSLYLNGVQCLLLAGAADEAAARLKTRRRFGRTQRYFDWMRDIVATPAGERLRRFDVLFDLARHPRFSPLEGESAQRIEELSQGVPAEFTEICKQWSYFGDSCMDLRLALLRWCWVQGRSSRGCWPQVIAQISRPGDRPA